jgi:hypothetical protein
MVDVGIFHHGGQGRLDILGLEFSLEMFRPQLLKLLGGQCFHRSLFSHLVILSRYGLLMKLTAQSAVLGCRGSWRKAGSPQSPFHIYGQS